MEETQTPPVKEDNPVKDVDPVNGCASVNGDTPVNKKPERAWYAVYTNSRAEKRVSDRINEMGIETFLPLQKTLRQWSDRKKLIEKPLISSYVFVRAIPKEFFSIRTTDGVVKFIMIQGKPVPIPEAQITNLRILCGSDAEVTLSSDVYAKGDKVEVIVGSLTGLRGELIRVGRKHKVVIRIIQPGMNLTIDIKSNAIRKLDKNSDI
jgi:transcription antitermination factor NusG